ncbi:DUF3110 domain-containing protein [Alkalinema sp. FACHB-956]|nr:DUF3110 domain-containing protein [Alkalinema sp. FACHB-956]MBD2325277.1 DUF3110 domain-containing protein [Alkalinema sp. FACHB-956]
MRVFVLLFNVGTDNEGLHSIDLGGQNIVLMFEEEDDATRYALMLEAQDFPEASVEAFPQEEIEEFCRDAGFDCRLIPQNFRPANDFERLLLAPPENNRDNFDWSPEGAPAEPASPTVDEPEGMSQDELEAMRRRLEGLL